ncbi:hypothetical protein [Shewanella youngdeokensis]|uniref:DUF3545 domain-containing protein n=1 Tax=Shewanella youngdeokensis TaxID=2999068 RepID=A0ABZ0JX68_9GAMM|nr:hypothetical protein RGE70_15845 [Shewanella sp. DAU334]
MAQILDFVPNDKEIDALAAPKNKKAADDLAHKRAVKKRLEAHLEKNQLTRDIGDDNLWA